MAAVPPAITIVKSVDADSDTVDDNGSERAAANVHSNGTIPSTRPLTVSAFADPTLNAAG